MQRTPPSQWPMPGPTTSTPTTCLASFAHWQRTILSAPSVWMRPNGRWSVTLPAPAAGTIVGWCLLKSVKSELTCPFSPMLRFADLRIVASLSKRRSWQFWSKQRAYCYTRTATSCQTGHVGWSYTNRCWRGKTCHGLRRRMDSRIRSVATKLDHATQSDGAMSLCYSSHRPPAQATW